MNGEVAYFEDITQGLENAPRGVSGSMLAGGNTGKAVVTL